MEDRELVTVEHLLVCVRAVGMVGMTGVPVTGRDLECGANEITDRLAPFNSQHAMVPTVINLRGTDDLDLDLVSTLGRY